MSQIVMAPTSALLLPLSLSLHLQDQWGFPMTSGLEGKASLTYKWFHVMLPPKDG